MCVGENALISLLNADLTIAIVRTRRLSETTATQGRT